MNLIEYYLLSFFIEAPFLSDEALKICLPKHLNFSDVSTTIEETIISSDKQGIRQTEFYYIIKDTGGALRL